MKIRLDSELLPNHTIFVLSEPTDTVAKVRGLVGHQLYGLGYDDCMVLLEYNNILLKDPYTLQDYGIEDGHDDVRMTFISEACISPLNGELDEIVEEIDVPEHQRQYSKIVRKRFTSIQQVIAQDAAKETNSGLHRGQQSLLKEVEGFKARAKLLTLTEVLIWIELISAAFLFVSQWWYTSLVIGAICMLALARLPEFHSFRGFHSLFLQEEKAYIRMGYKISGMLAVLLVVFFVIAVSDLRESCRLRQEDCGAGHVFIGFALALALLVSSSLSYVLKRLDGNCKLEPGDWVEKELIGLHPRLDVTKTIADAKDGDQIALQYLTVLLINQRQTTVNKLFDSPESISALCGLISDDHPLPTQLFAVTVLATVTSFGPQFQMALVDSDIIVLLSSWLEIPNEHTTEIEKKYIRKWLLDEILLMLTSLVNNDDILKMFRSNKEHYTSCRSSLKKLQLSPGVSPTGQGLVTHILELLDKDNEGDAGDEEDSFEF
eukprot:m.287252 g.287252  ORF g.287252 m.287252 type:complete len:490 (-) comp16360_c1_seq40:106-1575(-)